VVLFFLRVFFLSFFFIILLCKRGGVSFYKHSFCVVGVLVVSGMT
jgi:hypothetical protein